MPLGVTNFYKTSSTKTTTPARQATARLGPNPLAPKPSSALDMYGNPIGAPTSGTPSPYGAPNYQQNAQKSNAQSTTTGGGTGGSLYNSADADYIRNLPTGYTPEQQLAMRNRIRETQTAQNRGSDTKLRELLGQQGYGDSGYEFTNMRDLYGRQDAAAQGALSNLDISNAQTDLMNRYGKAGLLNQLMGTGLDENKLAEMGRQFDVGQYNDLYRWGQETDYQRQLDRLSNSQYNDQLKLMLQRLGLGL